MFGRTYVRYGQKVTRLQIVKALRASTPPGVSWELELELDAWRRGKKIKKIIILSHSNIIIHYFATEVKPFLKIFAIFWWCFLDTKKEDTNYPLFRM